jgi:ribonuclease HII
MASLVSAFTSKKIEAGCDEAGRGCLAGPVYAAAVILPKKYKNPQLNDSKKLSANQRLVLKKIIITDALAYAVASVNASEIDEINILNASFKAMHLAISSLKIKPELLLIDGNRFNPYVGIPHECVIKGDSKFLAIAAASVLAKTFRDEYMETLHNSFPDYGWNKNKGYPTVQHKMAIQKFGLTSYHRNSFNYHLQMKIDFKR